MSTSHQPPEKKRKQVLISSSDSEEDDVPVPVNNENLAKSLCNLQINMRELGEKFENMMEVFKGFKKEAMESLKGFEKEAKRLADGCMGNTNDHVLA